MRAHRSLRRLAPTLVVAASCLVACSGPRNPVRNVPDEEEAQDPQGARKPVDAASRANAGADARAAGGGEAPAPSRDAPTADLAVVVDAPRTREGGEDDGPEVAPAASSVSQPGPSPCAGLDGCRRLLYVAGERQDPGVKVYDIDRGHAFVKDLRPGGGDYKGIAAHATAGHLYLSSRAGDQVIAFDLVRERVVWTKKLGPYVDRLTVTPDGQKLFVPLRNGAAWVVLSAATGAEVDRIPVTPGKPHNTIAGASGRVYMTALDNPTMTVADAQGKAALMRVGPFGAGIRPFVIDAAERRVYVNVDGLLGFEIGDLTTGQKLHRIEVKGYPAPAKSYHGTPSHGVALTPDGREVWVVNAGGFVHVFDNTVVPPRQIADLPMAGDVGWVAFSIDGRYAYPATGEVVEVTTRKTLARVRPSEKQIEVVLGEGRVLAVGDQFGVGRAR